ncbi:unnamed protein product, partial [Mesorhabditis spiculigera]
MAHLPVPESGCAYIATLAPAAIGFVGYSIFAGDDLTQRWYQTLPRRECAAKTLKASALTDFLSISPLGYASFLVHRAADHCPCNKKLAMNAYGLNLLLLLAKNYATRNQNKTHLAGTSTLAAILAIATAVGFYKADKTAGLLMAPYAVWTSFQAYNSLQKDIVTVHGVSGEQPKSHWNWMIRELCFDGIVESAYYDVNDHTHHLAFANQITATRRFQQSMQQALSMAQQANQFERQHVLRPGDVTGPAPTPPSYPYTSGFSAHPPSYTYTSTSSGPTPARNSGNQTIVVVTNIPDEDDADLWKYMVKRMAGGNVDRLKRAIHLGPDTRQLLFESETAAKAASDTMRMKIADEAMIPNKKKLLITGLSADWTPELIYHNLLGASTMIKGGIQGVRPMEKPGSGIYQVIVEFFSEDACLEAMQRCRQNSMGSIMRAKHVLEPFSNFESPHKKLVLRGLPKDATKADIIRYVFMNDPELIHESISLHNLNCTAEFKTEEAATRAVDRLSIVAPDRVSI